MPDAIQPYELSQLTSFDVPLKPRLIFGNGCANRIGDLAREIGARRPLLVTDSGIVKAGHVAHVEEFLLDAGVEVVLFDKVHENPTTQDVAACLDAARAAKIDSIVGLGGGSSMDTAKGCNFLLTNGGRMQDYWGVGKATKPMLPFIAIPTTAGTGSECQSAALIADETTHQKMACLDPKVAARIAILDPTLTLSQPPRVTACTGIDAIAHAVETAVTKKKNPLSLSYSREAFQLCAGAFPKVLKNPNDLEARGRMLLGAAFAGIAIENSMLGAAHAAANPLTAHYGIVHGHAVGLMLPHVVRFNAEDAVARRAYEYLAPSEKIADQLERFLKLAGLPGSLSECGVRKKAIPALAEEAAEQWTASFNPRPVTKENFLKIYEAAF